MLVYDPAMLDVTHIVDLQQVATRRWHDVHAPVPVPNDPLDALVLEQHRANFDLWHREDSARDPLAADQAIAAVKRAIDKLNQRRNDLMERVDDALLKAVPPQVSDAPLHSESPGMMIDRLSILELKRYHTEEEIGRAGVAEEHRERNRHRLAVILEQKADLQHCLQDLWQDVLSGRRQFKLYRQMKMYNDPTLNPVLYGSARVSRE
jgi:hypothetical protein